MICLENPSLEEIRKEFPEAVDVFEDEHHIFVEIDKEGYRFVRTIKKPRTPFQITAILVSGQFPSKYIYEIYSAFENRCLSIVKKEKKGVVLCGPAGIGKTFACIWKVAELVKIHTLHSPVYIPIQEITPEDYKTFKKHDSYLIDDVNGNLPSWKVDFIRTVIYHAYNNEKMLLITSNLDKVSFLKFLNEEPIVSRLLEICSIYEIQDRDYRLKKAQKKAQKKA